MLGIRCQSDSGLTPGRNSRAVIQYAHSQPREKYGQYGLQSALTA